MWIARVEPALQIISQGQQVFIAILNFAEEMQEFYGSVPEVSYDFAGKGHQVTAIPINVTKQSVQKISVIFERQVNAIEKFKSPRDGGRV